MPGHASAAAIARGLRVQAKTPRVASGCRWRERDPVPCSTAAAANITADAIASRMTPAPSMSGDATSAPVSASAAIGSGIQ
jgi:hypothetical protein